MVSQPANAVPVEQVDYPPGERGTESDVSADDLSCAIGGSSAVSKIGQPLGEAGDQTTIMAKLNELIQAMRK